MSRSLLKLQIGPVQEFIAQARSTRDLWSGSYLLSWLMAAGLVKLTAELKSECRLTPQDAERAVIFPSLDEQPLYRFRRDAPESNTERRAVLTPNIPNLLVALLPMEDTAAHRLATVLKRTIEDEWRRLSDAVWSRLTEENLVGPDMADRFHRQRDRFLSVTWQVTAHNSDYAAASQLNAWQLDAVRQTRDFSSWAPGRWEAGEDYRKDFLTGREEVICGGAKWWREKLAPLGGFWPAAFRKRQAGDLYGAITLIKRLWYRTYLYDPPWNLKVSQTLPLPGTRQLAAGMPDAEEDDEADLPGDEDRYFAVLAMDGDDMGRWLSGAKSLPVTEADHRQFSARLSRFASDRAGQIVRQHEGRLIYAGGDDALALLPAQTAIACGAALRGGFRDAMQPDFEVSTGIAVAHYKAPLQDVIRAARDAERRAKAQPNKAALAVSLLKRSGEITEWTCRWADQGLEFYTALADALAAKQFSSRLPHRLVRLLTPYRTDVIVDGRRKVADAKGFDPLPVIAAELTEVLDRQRGRKWKHEVAAGLAKLAGIHLDRLRQKSDGDAINAPLRAFIGLAQTVAFNHRNRRPDA
ncbi:MAG: type III-B CRISPR-associated protein Cas10/Cmr2 [Limisphaerales bacterium]